MLPRPDAKFGATAILPPPAGGLQPFRESADGASENVSFDRTLADMAVNFSTDAPKALLNKFDAAIRQTDLKGKITTWQISDDGNYYTHKAAEWAKKAWFKPVTLAGRLTFNIIKPNDRNVTRLVYGYYHGHLIETFLNHFDEDFTTACASALATEGDMTK